MPSFQLTRSSTLESEKHVKMKAYRSPDSATAGGMAHSGVQLRSTSSIKTQDKKVYGRQEPNKRHSAGPVLTNRQDRRPAPPPTIAEAPPRPATTKQV